jgi:hypothetical protein
MQPRFVSILQRVMLRTGGGALRPLWWLAYEVLARAVGLYLRGRNRRAAVYARASLGVGDPIYGLSDIDLAIVLPNGPAIRPDDHEPKPIRARWRRLHRSLPLLPRLIEMRIEEDEDLRAVSAAPTLMHGLDGRAARPVYGGGPAAAGRPRLQERPGLYGPLCDWRLLAGPERRQPPRKWEPSARPIAAWLELQYWWRQAFWACLDPSGPWNPYLCVKLVSEPARILLWLVHGERIVGRKEVLERALELIPEEEPGLRVALAAFERLPDMVEPTLEDALRSLVRLSSRVAARLEEETAAVGFTEVRFLRADGGLPLPAGADGGLRAMLPGADPQLLPLTDWRARVVPFPYEPDESFAAVPGDPADAETLRRAALAGSAGPYPALRSGDLLVLATRDWLRGRLRAVQCAVTDPVSFALLAGRDRAAFPNARGWSAVDSAERAVAEHLGWLDEHRDGAEPPGESLGRLLAAARAAQFWTSVQDGEPVLPLTLAGAARTVASAHPNLRSLAEQACDEYQEYRLKLRPPSSGTVAALRRAVLRLRAYSAQSPRPPGG